MTKTLTEQWRDGTLEQKYYYVKHFGNCQKPFVEIELKNFLLDLVKVKDSDKIEVLAPVPDYQTWKDFQKHFLDRLELEVKLKKAYEQLEQESINVVELQEQLKDAEEALRFYDKKDFHYEVDGVVMGAEPAHKYFVKWGAK